MAAKKIQVSSDNGTNWVDLPGASGAFSSNGEQITDTILGQSFQSSQPGVIGWEVKSNAIWKGFAGYLCKILKSGTSTVMTTEAMTLVSGKTYKITNATKNVWNRAVTLNVFDNAVNHNSDVLDVDYLFGRVTFKAAYTVTGAVTVTGAYFPTAQLGKGNSFTLTQTADMIDTSDFATVQANSGYKTFIPGLRTVNLELGGIFDATTSFKALLAARGEIIVSIDPVGDGLSTCRGFFKLVDTEQSGDVGALEEESIQLTLAVPLSGTFTLNSVFKWIHEAGTTIPSAVQKCLDAWQGEINVDVRYLPQGAITQTPLDAITGDAYMSDVSLSGGLNDMNTFEATFMGTAAYTVV
jgi:hypothetical protein